MKSALVKSADIVGWDDVWLMVVQQNILSNDPLPLLMILYYGEKWYLLSFIKTLSI